MKKNMMVWEIDLKIYLLFGRLGACCINFHIFILFFLLISNFPTLSDFMLIFLKSKALLYETEKNRHFLQDNGALKGNLHQKDKISYNWRVVIWKDAVIKKIICYIQGIVCLKFTMKKNKTKINNLLVHFLPTSGKKMSKLSNLKLSRTA